MLEYIININFEDKINKDLILNLYKTKSSDINSIISSKIDNYDKISDFLAVYTDLDLNSISKSINNINEKFSNIIFPNTKLANDNLEQYINILSNFILTIHYMLKLKIMFHRKLQNYQQILLKNIINNNLDDALKDKIIELNSLSNSVLNQINLKEISFLNINDNKQRISNNCNTNGQLYFDLEDPTPKFFEFKKGSKEAFIKTKLSKENINKEIEEAKEFNNFKSTNKSSHSLISMSSILFINNNQKQKIPLKKSVSKNCRNQNAKKVPKKNHKIRKEIYEKKKIYSDKTLDNQQYKIFDTLEGLREKYIHIDENNIQNNDRKLNIKKMATINGNKELFIELLKFTNDLYQKKHIDENQKKILKQLIIKYIK